VRAAGLGPADLAALSPFATEPLLRRVAHATGRTRPGPNHTEVLRIEARLLAWKSCARHDRQRRVLGPDPRAAMGAHATPFRELWMLARLQGADRSWRVARVQALS
jgi:hypothetical protein